MYHRTSWFILALLVVMFSSCKTSEKIQSTDPITNPEFPKDWLGYWEGELKIYSENKLKQTVNMALDLSPTDRDSVYHWAIIYGSIENGRRPYELKVLDMDKGHLLIDEKNGLLLDAYLFENKIISQYEVMGNMLQTYYTLEGGKLVFEVAMGPGQAVRETITTDADSIAVKSYSVQVMQRAILERVKL